MQGKCSSIRAWQREMAQCSMALTLVGYNWDMGGEGGELLEWAVSIAERADGHFTFIIVLLSCQEKSWQFKWLSEDVREI